MVSVLPKARGVVNPLRSMAQRRVYARQGPEPKCPEHGAMRWTLGGYRCRWTREVEKEWGWATERCHYRPTDRREVEVEAWEEYDDGITFD